MRDAAERTTDADASGSAQAQNCVDELERVSGRTKLVTLPVLRFDDGSTWAPCCVRQFNLESEAHVHGAAAGAGGAGPVGGGRRAGWAPFMCGLFSDVGWCCFSLGGDLGALRDGIQLVKRRRSPMFSRSPVRG